jgi:hypothetical protein
MRDRLPDLANDSLEPAVRELVMLHLSECAACTTEIEILRTTRLMLLKTTPRVNVASIVMALPSYDSLPRAERGVIALPRYGATPITAASAARSRSWATSWRVAAAMTFLAAGIGSYAVLRPGSPVRPDSVSIRQANGDTTAGMALTGALADMSDAELSALASDIGQIEALPPADVETTTSELNVPPIIPDSIVRELEVR